MRPLLAGFESASVLAWRGREALTAGRSVAAARGLAESLRPARYVINLCESLECFLVATIATLVAGRTLVLPPTRLPRTLSELRAQYPDSVCVADAPVDGDAPTLGVERHIDAALRERSSVVDTWPAVADAHVAAILFTSGSTGTPQAHAKTWGELADGANALMRSIERPARDVAIAGSVPPQHMFGFETTVMLPLQSGTAVLDARPAFAADLADLLGVARAVAPGGVWLMTTPLQLRAFHREYRSLPGIAGVVASTMPLDAELAREVERDWRTTVREIYGCTEGGILAVRRASVATSWTPAHGVAFAISNDGCAQVSGGHLRRPLALADRLGRVDEHGAFELIGRDADLVKIGGKRASLAGLTRELASLHGVHDCAVFLPADDAQRVAALVVAPGVAADDLRRALGERIDPAFMPRPLMPVEALPRNAAGKLPLESLRSLIASRPASTARAPVTRTFIAHTMFARDHPALEGHFPGNPIVPGVLLLASVEQVLVESGLSVIACTHAKFIATVAPEQRLTISVHVDGECDARFEIADEQRVVSSGKLRCVAMEDVR